MKTCKICGCSFDEENFEGIIVNEGMDNEYHVCCDCVPSECNNGHIISCEACGSYFSADKLHDEEIEGHSFTACPACGKDVVEGLSRAEFEDEYFCPRYSVVVRQFNGSVRGYIVSANGRHEVMKRLLEKLVYLTCILLCLYLGWVAWASMATAIQKGSFESRTFDMPKWAIFLPIFLGFALSALEWLRFLLTPASLYDANPLEAEGI